MDKNSQNNYHGSAFPYSEGGTLYLVVFRCKEIPEPATGITLMSIWIIGVKDQSGNDCLPELNIEQIERVSCEIAIKNIIEKT
ncbi:hypothetical protein [Belliella aquatica]|uniref:Uncharacterized protein n=1 Tax=Belliella aquatica TaxID=1323734 RepID=A0ABQ1M5H8_9BACT|nr:hypothetical protein [Belliella aquatica]MCH7404638.1 hypothetical protein [Belliella aquatica]GGC35307.1 hypothetical protein GCM10010993_12780 [Belliella aquatica]